jgi:two-component system, cell cycle sensor histidine kinase and response regulator CckA
VRDRELIWNLTVESAASSRLPMDPVPTEIAARERLMSCMQELARDLGQANKDLERELARRSRLSRAVSRSLPPPVEQGEFESLLLASGSLGLMSLPPGGNGSPTATDGHTVLTSLPRRFTDGTRFFVNHLRSVPRWESLAGVLQRSRPTEAARLTGLAADLVALRLAQPILQKLRQNGTTGVCSPETAGVMITDSDGVIRLVNHRLGMLTGLTTGDLLGRSWLRALVPEEDWAMMRGLPGFPGPVLLRDRDVWIKGGQSRPFPVRMFTRGLQQRARKVGAVTVIIVEGTEHYERMEDLANRERLYRRVFEEDVTRQYTCTPDGNLLTCNAAFARIFGFASVAEALKGSLRQLHLNGEAADHFMEELTRRRRLVYYESTMRRVDGRKIHVIRNVSGEFDADGRLREITGFVFDKTEHRRLEDRVRQSQKMETVGRLAGGIAHDFNNLLLAIQGYASLLAEHVADKPEGADALGHIQRAADRATTLTRQLLAFSRRQVLQPRELDLNEVVRALVPLLQRLVGEPVQLETQLAPDLGLVRADRAQLEEVLVNLATNARDAMPRGGHLLLTSRNVALRDTWFAFHDGPPPGDYVELSVQDNGTGMTEEVKAHLFEPFFTTKEQGKGTGLGLPTVYGVIKQSGGEVQAYSTLGEGTTIKLLLPRLAESPVQNVPPTSTTPAPGKFTLLLVEDEPPVRSLVKRILVRAGHQVLDAGNASEALALIEQTNPHLDLLVTDLVLPGMSGRELWEHLQAHQPDLPVVYMSGYTEDAVIKHGVLHSKLNFLQKPFKPEALVAKVNAVLASG